MTRYRRWTGFFAFALLGAAGARAETAWSLGNAQVQRAFTWRADGWRTAAFTDERGGYALPVEGVEFAFTLWEGPEYTSDGYVSESPEPPAFTAPAAGHRGRVAELAYRPRDGAPEGAPARVVVRFEVRDGEPVLRKTVTVELAEGQAVDELRPEDFTAFETATEQGGKGEPVFLGPRAFTGLEYPAGFSTQTNGAVALKHYPGYAKQDPATGRWLVTSKTAVFALAPEGVPVRAFFTDYLDTVRIRPRNMLHYNSWYDLRGKEVTPANLVAIYKGYRQHLVEPYGVDMDTFVPDDGYQEKDSLWEPRAEDYPNGFADLRDGLEALGTRLGLWLPLDGYLLNADWGEAQGYERASVGGEKKNYYCLAGPAYDAAIRAALKRVLLQGHLAYMKHDFNFLQCDAEGHGHLPTARHGHEANLDAQLELLAWERSIMPDIFLNVTSLAWHSPWWLMHADTIWMCAGDHGFDDAFPQMSSRTWEMTYRDAHFHRLLAEQRHLVPVSAYMTHGIIFGRYERIGDAGETLREWSDAALMYYGRGVQLKELYVDPDLLQPAWWKALGETTRWAIANAPTLERVAMIGGNPHAGEPYGYLHWKGARAILVARNPGLPVKTLRVPFDAGHGYRLETGEPYRARAVYPHYEELPLALSSGRAFDLVVPGDSVVAVELLPGRPRTAQVAAPRPYRVAMAQQTREPAGLTVRVPVPNETMPLCALRLLVEDAVLPDGVPVVTINGLAAAVRESAGEGWTLRDIDLRPYRGRDALVRVELPRGAEALFTPDFTLSAWFVADREVARPNPPHELTLPHLVAQRWARQTMPVIEHAVYTMPGSDRALTEADLEDITAAKLRIEVFDVNGGPEFTGKPILLNGAEVAAVPPNTRGLSTWNEKFIDLDPAFLPGIVMSNRVQVKNDGDYFKFRGLALAVRLKDGAWVRTNIGEGVQHSVTPWAFAEGEAFDGGASKPVDLVFPAKEGE